MPSIYLTEYQVYCAKRPIYLGTAIEEHNALGAALSDAKAWNSPDIDES